jgi:hypothetical protein
MTKIGSGATGVGGGIAATGVSAVQSSAGTATGQIASAAMSAVASKITKTIGKALNLLGQEQTGSWQGNPNDPYEIAELVARLSAEMDGNANDIGELERALHGFAQESAALFTARPESASLIKLQRVIEKTSSDGNPASFAAVTRSIDQATLALSSHANI